MALRLGVSKQRLQRETTSTEFLDWCEILEQDTNNFHREDFYLAQIAVEVRKLNAKYPNRLKIEDGILEFKTRSDSAQLELDIDEEEESEDDAEARRARQLRIEKSIWFGIVGYTGEQ